MNITPLSVDYVRRQVRQTHSMDDELLQDLLNSAVSEALRFMNRTELPTEPYLIPSQSSSEEVPSSEDPVAADVCRGVCLLVQADYDGDPTARKTLRDAAESLLHPHRIGLGV
jgi:hypothetical protein